MIAGWLLTAWFGASLAMLLGALAEKTEIVERLWHPAAYLLFPLSGAVFLVDALPAAAQKYVLYIPMVSGVEMVREGYFGDQVTTHYDAPYLAGFCVVLTLLALIKVSEVNHGVTPE